MSAVRVPKRTVKRPTGEEYAALTRHEVFAQTGSGPSGLDQPTAAERLLSAGPNEINEAVVHPLPLRFFEHFYHLFALMLWVGAALAFLGGLPELAWAIIAVIVINAVFSFWQEYRAEKATEALKRLIPRTARVVRAGVTLEIPAAEVVFGDLLVLEEGGSIPADARLVEQFELRVDQASLTGESTPVRRSAEPATERYANSTDIPNLVFAGTNVVHGRGSAVVVATGMDTHFGTIAGLTQSLGDSLSPLQREMGRVTRLVAVLATTLGAVFFSLGYFVAELPLVTGLLFAVGIIVANVPEGLLPTVTLALAMGVQRMARRAALVKRLSAVETLGSTTVICTDKTGTLTANEMTVRAVWIPDSTVEVTGTGYEPVGEVLLEGLAPPSDTATRVARALKVAAACSDARLVEPDDSRPSWRIIGDPTEGALVVAARKLTRPVSGDHAGAPAGEPEATSSSAPRVLEFPFDSVRKRMSTVHAAPEGLVLFAKGAPRELLELCARLCDEQGVRPMTEDDRAHAMRRNDEFARAGMRVLAVAERHIGHTDAPRAPDEAERDLTFLGLIAMHDPPRPEVERVVAQCKTAGIRIIMVTGDYGLTAESIARRVGIVEDISTIVSGPELEALSEEDLAALLASDKPILFARVAPEHKMRIALSLKSLGHTVAMTGDGVNDAPALKAADIGVAMGASGTDVAREAADMVLADDNFASIVHAIEEGRAVYDNIRRFVTYIFTSNIPEIVPFILFVIFGIPLPLTVLQIIAIDLGTDILPALALGIEKPERDVMRRPPRPRSERLLDRRVLTRAYFFLGPIQAVACMGAYFWAYWSRGWRPGIELPDSGELYMLATTMTFGAVVATQIGNAFAQRTTRESITTVGFFSNRLLLVGIATEIALFVLLTHWPPLAGVFGFVPIEARDWLVLAALAPVLLIADELRKSVLRRMRGDGVSADAPLGGNTPRMHMRVTHFEEAS
ncbi:MAG: cation-transporting P-type ATPase [Clostridiales bacterium]|nr:cation-transporting P-type ATPase [Clostridiales bacterium]